MVRSVTYGELEAREARKVSKVIDMEESMSREDIKKELDAKGIEYKANAKTEQLQKLLG